MFYLLSYTGLLFYGGRVCPYIDNLDLWQYARDLAAFFAAGLLLRFFLTGKIREPWAYARAFWIELAVFAFMSGLLTFYNYLAYDFPLGSGLKVGVGFIMLGFFLGLQAYLGKQRQVLRSGESPVKIREIHSSIVSRISAIMILSVSLATAVIFLVVNKDLQWLEAQPPGTLSYHKGAVLFEIVFVMGVLLLLLIHLVLSYASNLKLLFANQTGVLEKVSHGQFESYVPVISNDEFGSIALHTNTMIDGLREKAAITAVFGKAFSPGIARMLLEGEQQLGGKRMDLTFLMSDVRAFTALAESLSPEELLNRLNAYFSDMVGIIHAHQGEIDKFIGDGILAVFGMDGHGGEERAVRTALAMLERMKGKEGGWQIGIGIHSGEVVAGRIGSLDRQEYTFIGDTVNTVARLESACKENGASLIISDAVYAALPEDLKGEFGQRLELTLRGKSSPFAARRL
ncbi:MAG: adenylate/guanylate cyclase domain-containing protein [Spirochaetales bacterium]|nr:adenylate/guanylate cyclase domain-containing protein [Spirochaetales bacterium]